MKMIQKCISGCLALLMLLAMVPVQALAAEVSWEELPGDAELPEVPKLPQQAVAGEPLDIHLSFTSQEDKTAEELYEEYAMQVFFPSASGDVTPSAAWGMLEGDEKVLYDELRRMIKWLAVGDYSSTVFSIGEHVEYEGEIYYANCKTYFHGYEFTQLMFDRVITALLSDLPYECYWFDKVSGCFLLNGFVDPDGKLLQLTVAFSVAQNYRGEDEFSVDTQKAAAATQSVENAKEITSRYSNASDYERLKGYMDGINDLVSYDFDAAEGMYFTEDIDPWQLISVFDGDDSTNVVCEGYAKAYTYLCNMYGGYSHSIECYTVSGYMEGIPHMWNIVSIDGYHYLVDVTNSDTGTIGESGGLFLAGGTGSPEEGYQVNGLYYFYDESMLNLWGTEENGILTLEAIDCGPDGPAREVIASGPCGENVIWALDNKGLLTISGTGDMEDYSSRYDTPWSDYYSKFNTIHINEGVTSIGANAFQGQNWLIEIHFPSSVTKIGREAFSGCHKLTELILPEALTTISYGMLSYCDRLTSITIPNSVTVIEGSAFSSCESLTEIILPENLVSIGDSAFRYCPYLQEITIPNSVTYIGENVFGDCSQLKAIVIPEQVTSIGARTFDECFALEKVIILGSVTSIGRYAFYRCTSLKEITIPNSVTLIEDCAFEECSQLKEITIPNQVTSIEHNTFYNCTALEKVTLPESVISIAHSAFENCTSLTDVYYLGTKSQWENVAIDERNNEHLLNSTIHCMKVDTPAISKLESTGEGVKITWGAVDGAAQYRVYYKTTGGWTKITDTTDTSFVWTGAKSGTTYAFTVRCLNAAGNAFTSEANTTGWKHTYIAQPAISKLESTGEGVKITWGKVGGAERYRVYLKSGNSWKVIGNTADTSFVYTGAEIGTTYTFTVRCFDAENKVGTSTYSNTGWSHKYNPVPRISALTSEVGGIKITWDPIKGVEKYRVYVKNASGGWTKLTDTTATEYVYTGAKLGETYTFTVRGITPDGKGYTTTYSNTGWSHKYYPSPVISKMESVANGVKITWKAVKGAERYRVYVKSGTGGWKNVGSTTGTSFTWTGAKSGTEYSFTVRCVDADNKNFTSNYNTTGWNHTYIGQPAISNLESIPEGVKITWGEVAGAERYRVYVKSGTGWKVLGNTTDNSIVWTGAQAGKTYTFTVRCYNADNTAGTSTYNTTGWSHKYYPTPEITKLESAASGVKITWDAINGTAKYRVYVKTETGWKKLTDTAETSFVWADAVLGQTYTFTLRGITADGKGYTTTYSNTGWAHKYYPAPEISGLESTAEGISLSWKAIHGAERYRVYIKSGTSWKVIGTTDGTGFVYADAVAGETYTFTVRCVDAANKVTTSDYNKTGWSITHN